MKVVSINVGRPKKILFQGKEILTAIEKKPVDGPLELQTLNFRGDEQADLTVHGGQDKAVYAMSTECYAWWKSPQGGHDVGLGTLGENLSVEGLFEDQIFIGDVFKLGSAEIQVTQPRLPCVKLNAILQDSLAGKKMMQSQMPGVYFRVLKPGQVRTDDAMALVGQESTRITVLTLFNHLMRKNFSREEASEYLKIRSLNARLKQKFQEALS
ncbi:MAG: MOSC domain-containing protein [Bdellovibrionales bacterium]|nr:MOSC domain-containing protein [Bdellovibrionales bacterium]